MKKISLFILVVGLCFFIVGCSIGTVEPPSPSPSPTVCEEVDINQLSPEIKHLLRFYLYRNPYSKIFRSITRWPCGIIYVFDETNYEKTKEILDMANQLIGGPTRFELTKNQSFAKIKIIVQEGGLGEIQANELTGEYEKLTIFISRNIEGEDKEIMYFFRIMNLIFFFGTLFRDEKEREDFRERGIISENYKKVIYWGYRLPVGMEIDPNW